MIVGRRTLEESCKKCPGAKRKTEEKSRFPAREVVSRPNSVVNVPLTELICPAVDALCRLVDIVGDAALAVPAQWLRHATNGARDAAKGVARPRLLICELLIRRLPKGLADATHLRTLCSLFLRRRVSDSSCCHSNTSFVDSEILHCETRAVDRLSCAIGPASEGTHMLVRRRQSNVRYCFNTGGARNSRVWLPDTHRDVGEIRDN